MARQRGDNASGFIIKVVVVRLTPNEEKSLTINERYSVTIAL
jgi:hypothetical protein